MKSMTFPWLGNWRHPAATTLFLYGALAHAVMLRIILDWSYPDPAEKFLPDSTLLAVGVPILGGFSFVAIVGRLLSEQNDSGRRGNFVRFVLRGGALGVAATWSVLLATLVFISLSSSFRSGLLAPIVALFILMGSLTYGMESFILSTPISFSFGVILGISIILGDKLRRKRSSVS